MVGSPPPAIWHAAASGLVAAIAVPALIGTPTFPSLARVRLASKLAAPIAVGGLVFCVVLRLSAPSGG